MIKRVFLLFLLFFLGVWGLPCLFNVRCIEPFLIRGVRHALQCETVVVEPTASGRRWVLTHARIPYPKGVCDVERLDLECRFKLGLLITLKKCYASGLQCASSSEASSFFSFFFKLWRVHVEDLCVERVSGASVEIDRLKAQRLAWSAWNCTLEGLELTGVSDLASAPGSLDRALGLLQCTPVLPRTWRLDRLVLNSVCIGGVQLDKVVCSAQGHGGVMKIMHLHARGGVQSVRCHGTLALDPAQGSALQGDATWGRYEANFSLCGHRDQTLSFLAQGPLFFLSATLNGQSPHPLALYGELRGSQAGRFLALGSVSSGRCSGGWVQESLRATASGGWRDGLLELQSALRSGAGQVNATGTLCRSGLWTLQLSSRGFSGALPGCVVEGLEGGVRLQGALEQGWSSLSLKTLARVSGRFAGVLCTLQGALDLPARVAEGFSLCVGRAKLLASGCASTTASVRVACPGQQFLGHYFSGTGALMRGPEGWKLDLRVGAFSSPQVTLDDLTFLQGALRIGQLSVGAYRVHELTASSVALETSGWRLSGACETALGHAVLRGHLLRTPAEWSFEVEEGVVGSEQAMILPGSRFAWRQGGVALSQCGLQWSRGCLLVPQGEGLGQPSGSIQACWNGLPLRSIAAFLPVQAYGYTSGSLRWRWGSEPFKKNRLLLRMTSVQLEAEAATLCGSLRLRDVTMGAQQRGRWLVLSACAHPENWGVLGACVRLNLRNLGRTYGEFLVQGLSVMGIYPGQPHARGELYGQMRVSGSLMALKSEGILVMRSPLKTLGVKLVLEARGRSFALGGEVHTAPHPLTFQGSWVLGQLPNLQVRGQGVRINTPLVPLGMEGRLHAVVRPDLHLSWDRGVCLSGALRLSEGEMFLDLESPVVDVISEDEQRMTLSGLMPLEAPPPKVSLSLCVEDQLEIVTSRGRAHVGGRLQLTYGEQLDVQGRIDVVDTYHHVPKPAHCFWYGQKLLFRRGSLLFLGAWIPRVEVEAIRDPETTEGELIVGVKVYGDPMRLTTLPFSDPPMSDERELLSLLLLGRKGHFDQMTRAALENVFTTVLLPGILQKVLSESKLPIEVVGKVLPEGQGILPRWRLLEGLTVGALFILVPGEEPQTSSARGAALVVQCAPWHWLEGEARIRGLTWADNDFSCSLVYER